MIDVLHQKLSNIRDNETKLNLLREFLQVLALKIIFDKNGFNNISFTGGTALRIIFGLKRFSEDMDFSLINPADYSFSALTGFIITEFKNYGIAVEGEPKEDKILHSFMFKFPNILNNLNISKIKGHKLSIKLEIDTNPPKGGVTQVSPITDNFIFAVTHFDLPSMFATKLHACFFRKYTKGRDFYDLVWYLGKKITPNFELLNAAITQTQKQNLNIKPDNLSSFLSDKISTIDFDHVKKDVERFLENKSELKMLDKPIILSMLPRQWINVS